jgi:hypothetical protein
MLRTLHITSKSKCSSHAGLLNVCGSALSFIYTTPFFLFLDLSINFYDFDPMNALMPTLKTLHITSESKHSLHADLLNVCGSALSFIYTTLFFLTV